MFFQNHSNICVVLRHSSLKFIVSRHGYGKMYSGSHPCGLRFDRVLSEVEQLRDPLQASCEREHTEEFMRHSSRPGVLMKTPICRRNGDYKIQRATWALSQEARHPELY